MRGDTLNIVWEDNRNRRWDIYYRRVILPPAGAEQADTSTAMNLSLAPIPNPVTAPVVFRIAGNCNRAVKLFRQDGTLMRHWQIPTTTPAQVRWNSGDEQGRLVRAGIYYAVFTVGSRVVSARKIILGR